MESLKRTLAKSLIYRGIHFIIHLGEAYIAIDLFGRFGHMGPLLAVIFIQFVCWVHYIGHERLFARLKWGYKKPLTDKEFEKQLRTPLEQAVNKVGFKLMAQGKYAEAQKVYENMLYTILDLEKSIGIRIHKGLFYHNIGLCLFNQGLKKSAKKYFELASREDRITYKEEAHRYPASEALVYLAEHQCECEHK